MKKTLLLLALAIGICAGTSFATIITTCPNAAVWHDMYDNVYDGYVEAQPGDTVTAFVEVNYHWNTWSPIRAYASGVWWDTAVLDRPESCYDYSGSPMINDTGGAYGSTTQGEYWGNENASTYGGANYQQVIVDGFGGYIYDMRVVGWTFTVRADAPLGLTTVGQRLLVYDYYNYYWRAETRVESDDPFALRINVVPEPATMGLLGLGGLAALLRRRRK